MKVLQMIIMRYNEKSTRAACHTTSSSPLASVPLSSEPWPAFCYQNIFRNTMVMTDITHKNRAALLHILHVNHNFDLLRLLLKKVRHHTFVVFFIVYVDCIMEPISIFSGRTSCHG